MSDERCETCRFVVTVPLSGNDQQWVIPILISGDTERPVAMYCHLNAPVRTDAAQTSFSRWPQVADHDWCGEWAARHPISQSSSRYDVHEHICCPVHENAPATPAEGDCYFCPGVKLTRRSSWAHCPCCETAQYYNGPQPDDWPEHTPWAEFTFRGGGKLIQRVALERANWQRSPS